MRGWWLMADLVKRLRNPPFGTETSERNLMGAAADRIEALEADLAVYAKTMAVISTLPAISPLRETIAGEIRLGEPYEAADRIIAALLRDGALIQSGVHP